MTKPLIRLLVDGKPIRIYANGEIDGTSVALVINGAMPLFDAIQSLCLDSKSATPQLHGTQPQGQPDHVLADRILELLQDYGQRWQVPEESKE